MPDIPDPDSVRVCGDTARNYPERLMGGYEARHGLDIQGLPADYTGPPDNHPNARDILEGRATAAEVLASADAEGDALQATVDAIKLPLLKVALERAEALLEQVHEPTAPGKIVGGTNLVALSDEWFAERRSYFASVERLLERDPFKP